MTRRTFLQFWRDEAGTALVEFGLLLPTFLLFIAVSVEGSRTFWSYQTTIAGVRDAARYLSRVVPQNICATGGSTTAWDAKLTEIVRLTQDGQAIFPSAITVDEVTSTLACATGDYRNGEAPVATVSAQLQIQYPFAGIFTLFGSAASTVNATVTDNARILGS